MIWHVILFWLLGTGPAWADYRNRPVTITNADGVVLTRTYDLLNRIITNTWPDTSTERFQYSTNGLIAYTNQDGQVTLFTRDGSGRVLSITDNLQHSNEFSYDALDHVLTLTDGLGHNTTWNFNQYGWMSNKLNNLNASVLTNGFDANGQLTTRWMPATGITTYKWDAVGNLTNITYPQRTDAYSYDADNRLTGMADTNGADVLLSSFTYTQVGQLATETGPWTSNTLTYTYNEGHRASLSLNSQIPTINQTYGYDSAWRLQSLASLAGAFNYGYTSGSASGLVRTVSLPNAASIVENYDSLARLDYTALLNYWGHPLDGYAYISDSWGLRTNITRQLGLSTNIVTDFFDGIGQLKTWSGRETNGTLRQNEQLGYAYDAAGNLQYRTNGAMIQTFTVNTLNQISNVTRTGTFTVSGATPAPATSVSVNSAAAQINGDFTFAGTNNSLANGNNTFTIIARNMSNFTATNILTVNLPATVNFQYDANGNLTNDGARWFCYDAENQLTNVTSPSQWQVVFVYDGLNRRRIERDSIWTNSAWLKTNETRFLYDGMQVVQERDTNNNPVVTYTRGLDLSMSLTGTGGVGGMLARTDTNGSTYYHADGAGNITAMVDGNENIVARYEYDAFGRLINKQGSMADANRYHFSSKEYVSQAGVYYYGFRFYEPNSQRWLNRDPIQEAGGVNLYQFVGNGPANTIDIAGLAANAVIGPNGSAVGPSGGLFEFGEGNAPNGPFYDPSPYTFEPMDNPITGIPIMLGQALAGLGGFLDYLSNKYLDWGGEGFNITDMLMALGPEFNELKVAPELAAAGECEAAAKDTAYLYQKLGAVGEHLKFGVTGSLTRRYTAAELNGGRLVILAQGQRADMLQLERNLHETLPIGPEEGQQFYIQKQVSRGFIPPPYNQ